MIKKIALLFIFVILLISNQSLVHGSEDFKIDVNVTYEILDSGITHVTHRIRLENKKSRVHAKEFTLDLASIDPTNIKATEIGEAISFNKIQRDNKTSIKVDFEDAVVGKGSSRIFTIEFDESSFASRTGEVWEISIPRLDKDSVFDSYDLNLVVPTSFGNEAYISPSATTYNLLENKHVYEFNKDSLIASGVSAGFGKFQVFSFSLSYHLENPLNRKSEIEIALPPDTSIQRMYYSEILPEPENITIDIDGNWLAKYTLDARERLDVTAKGSVEIFASPHSNISVSQDSLEVNLRPTKYWQSDNSGIIALANTLKTPEAIYDYVVDNFSYNYLRVTPNVNRLGAEEALRQPENAICMEFTDTFIALARAAGIPAREINGFAYTENPEIEPLSLVADVLHAWPEYWDKDKKTWIPVDPTWGSTTGGVDYFNKLDLRHFTFVIHGASDTQPFPPGSYKLGPNPQKDVFVSFGQIPAIRNNTLKVTAERVNTLPFIPGRVRVEITNPGPRAEYGLIPKVGYLSETLESKYVDIMPPFSTYSFEVTMPYSFWGTNVPDSITVTVKNVNLEIATLKDFQVVMNMIITSLLLILVVVLILLKTGKFKKKSKPKKK